MLLSGKWNVYFFTTICLAKQDLSDISFTSFLATPGTSTVIVQIKAKIQMSASEQGFRKRRLT